MIRIGVIVEFFELMLDAFSVGVAALFPVQPQCLQPRRAGLLALSEGDVGVAHVVEDVRDLRGVAKGAEQGKGLVVVVEGLPVLAGAVGDEPEAVQGLRLTFGVVLVSVQGEGGSAVFSGGVELAQPRRIPAHRVERVSFPRWLVEGAVEVEGVSGVLQRAPVVPAPFPGVREGLVGVCLFDGVVVAYGQIEGPVQVPDGLLVQT